MTICVRDQQDRPVAGLSGKWSGYATEGVVWKQPFAFDPEGCVRIERYDLHTNVFSLGGAALKGVFPHQSGLVSTTADVHVSLPDGYEVDEAASGLKRHNNLVSDTGIFWEDPVDMMFYVVYGYEAFYEDPGGKRIMLYPGRPKPPDEFVISLL